MKRILVFALAILMLVPVFGCARSGDRQELWIVTERTTWDQMNGQTWVWIDEFEENHPGITVKLDILPTDTQERSVYLQQLRTRILRGGGPDGYLLPTTNELTFDNNSGYIFQTVEPLFSDAYQAMENGIFLDISEFYNNDSDLDAQSLLQPVMDAGVLEGKRYILPLRYDIPMVYGDAAEMEKAGISPESLEQGILSIMEAAARTQDGSWAYCALRNSEIGALGGWMNYDTQGVNITAEQIGEYLTLYRTLMSRGANQEEVFHYDTKLRAKNYVWKNYKGQFVENALVEENEGKEGSLPRYPLYVGGLADILDYAAIYQYEDAPLCVEPIRGLDNQVVAKVTYYVAVGAGCDDPALAYEFLREFLTQKFQWEENRPQSKNAVGDKGRIVNTQNASQCPGLIAAGWPVRMEGSLASLWKVVRKQFYSKYAADSYKDVMRGVGLSDLEESWEKNLDVEIHRVCFGADVTETFAEYLGMLNDAETYAATDADPLQLADRLLWQLRLQVGEG